VQINVDPAEVDDAIEEMDREREREREREGLYLRVGAYDIR
jgi:hypothetical protein